MFEARTAVFFLFSCRVAISVLLSMYRCDDRCFKKVKSNYFIVRPKVDQRAGLLSLPHLGIFAIHTR